MQDRTIVERLERAGFMAARTARELAAVRTEFPVRDALARRFQVIEEETAALARDVASELRELDDACSAGRAA